MDEYFPEFTKVFKNLEGKAASHVLYNYPFPKYLMELGVEGILQEFNKCLKKGASLKRAKKLYEAVEVSVGVKVGLEVAKIKLRSNLEEETFI